jgi:hypothetical protein
LIGPAFFIASDGLLPQADGVGAFDTCFTASAAECTATSGLSLCSSVFAGGAWGACSDSMAEGFAVADFPLFAPFFGGGALAACFTTSTPEGFAAADLTLVASFFLGSALPLTDDSEDATATADLGGPSVGFHAVAVALRIA